MYGFIPYIIKLPAPKIFSSKHDGKAVHSFLNACKTYFKLTGISSTNIQALFFRTRLIKIAKNWYKLQGYNVNILTFDILRA